MSKTLKTALIILALNCVTHFFFLNKPASVVFDEVHFGKFVSSYCCTHKNFFDIHPPHSKLLIAASAKMGGYDGTFAFKNIGDAYGTTPVLWLRFIPAVVGILLPVVFFLLLLQFGATLTAATFGALCLTLDNALLIQTRIIALDGTLLLGIFGALLFYLKAEAAHHWRIQRLLFLASGCMVGLAVGTKYTGLTSMVVLVAIALQRLVKNQNLNYSTHLLRSWIWLLSGFLAVYLVGWAIHFQILVPGGPGDAFYIPRGDFFYDFVKLQKLMIERNASISTPHSGSSFWWQWPTMDKPIYYWTKDNADIYFIGNPIVWWFSWLFFVSLSIHILTNVFFGSLRTRQTERRVEIWIPLVGFLIAYTPHITITRPLFLYHYLPSLIFTLTASILWLDQLGWFEKGPKRQAPRSILYAGVLVMLGFILVMPLTYGFPKDTSWAHLAFKIFPGWR